MARNGILVTGGTGLVGVYTVALLLEKGERPVVYDVKLNEKLLHAVGVDLKAVSLVQGDILDLPGLRTVIQKNDIDRVIHLAASMGEEVQRQPHSGARLNVLGTMNVLEAARLESISRVVYGSSGSVYLGSLNKGMKKIDETIPLNPPSLYAATKASSELLGRCYAQGFGFEFVCVRYVGGLYGPSPVVLKSTREQAIGAMVRAAIKGQATSIQWPYGPSELVYGKDAAKGTVLACLKEGLKDHLFHIGSGELIGGDDVLRQLKKQFNNLKITLQKKGKAPLPHPEFQILNDNSRSHEQLGYEPDFPLEIALGDYAATLRHMEAHPSH
jgi:UDP-glucose 4-epimerase